MALIVGNNCYLSLDEANTYFESRPFSDEFTSLDDNAKKEAALIQATKLIDLKKYQGYRTNSNQKLAFPRVDLYDDGISLDSNIVPQKVKDAVCELAIYILQEDYSASDDLAEFGKVKVGSLEIETKDNARGPMGMKEFPPIVKQLLSFAIASNSQIYRG